MDYRHFCRSGGQDGQEPELSCYGEVIFTRTDGGSITCDHADPRVYISDELLHQIANDEIVHSSLVLADGTPAHDKPERPEDLFGAVLTFDCTNRRLVYRITGWEPIGLDGDEWHGTYLAEWPEPAELVRPARKLRVVYQRVDGSWTATSPDLEGFEVTGVSLEEAKARAAEDLSAFLDPAVELDEKDVV